MLMRSGTHDSDAICYVLTVCRHTANFVNGEALCGASPGENQPELATMEMHMGQPKFVQELPNSLSFPVVALPGMLEADDAPRLAAGSGDLEHMWQPGEKQFDMLRHVTSRAVTLSPV
jgi:hypothetical protein